MKKELKKIAGSALAFMLMTAPVYGTTVDMDSLEEEISFDFNAYSDYVYQKEVYGDYTEVYKRTKTPIEGKEGYYIIGESNPMNGDSYIADSEGNRVTGNFWGISSSVGKNGTIGVSERAGMSDSRAGLLNYDLKLIVPTSYYWVEVRELGGKVYADPYPSSKGYDLEGNVIENVCKFLIGENTDRAVSDSALDCGDWAKEDIKKAVSNGIVPASVQGDYTAKITREEFCELAVRLYAEKSDGYIEWKDEIENPEKPFDDTDNPCVAIAYMLGLVNGTGNGCFSPESYITRQEAAVMLVNLAEAIGADIKVGEVETFIDESYFADWAYESIYKICGISSDGGTAIMVGTEPNKFSPWFNYQRQQAVVTMERLFETNTDGQRDIRESIKDDIYEIADSYTVGDIQNSLFKKSDYSYYCEKWDAMAETSAEESYIDEIKDAYGTLAQHYAFCEYFYLYVYNRQEEIQSMADDIGEIFKEAADMSSSEILSLIHGDTIMNIYAEYGREALYSRYIDDVKAFMTENSIA